MIELTSDYGDGDFDSFFLIQVSGLNQFWWSVLFVKIHLAW